VPTTTLPLPLRSSVRGVHWPALPEAAAAQVLAQLFQLDASQWLSRDELERLQARQLSELVRFAVGTSEFYRHAVAEAGVNPEGPWTPLTLSRLPLLSRRALQQSASSIHSRVPPKSHGELKVVETSGSSGEPVRVKHTGITDLRWLALNMREHLWHRRDVTQTLVAIRPHLSALDDETIARSRGWGQPVTLFYETGPAYTQSIRLDVREQARWVLERDPGYLLTFPTNLAGLIDEFDRLGRQPKSLLQVRTVGETVSSELRERCQARLGVPIVDAYSSQEVGAIAAACPESGLYHVNAEYLIVEVLDEAGLPCPPGKVGRVVITDLLNFATPLIRYDIRDYAEVGPECPCGRGLPTLRCIVGRERNMLRLPTGARFWAFVGARRFEEVAEVLQFQVIQPSLEKLEVRLVVAEGKLTEEQQARLRSIVRETTGYPFEIEFTIFPDELPRGRGGKFEEFICLVQH